MTLTEVMAATAILAVVTAGVAGFFGKIIPMLRVTRVRQQTETEARVCMETIIQRLRNGRARTVQISSPENVPNSRIDFRLQSPLPGLPANVTQYSIYLSTGVVYAQAGDNPSVIAPKALASNVTSLSFTGSTSDFGLIYVTLRIDAPWDTSNDPTRVSTIIMPNQMVHMVETQ